MRHETTGGIKAEDAEVMSVPTNELGQQLIRQLRSGQSWLIFSPSSKRVRLTTIYWLEEGGHLGEIVWCEKGRDPVKTSGRHRLSVDHITGIMVGSACPHSSEVPSENLCLTFTGKGNHFDLVAPTVEGLEALLNGIKYILHSGGRKMQQMSIPGTDSRKETTGCYLTVDGVQPDAGYVVSAVIAEQDCQRHATYQGVTSTLYIY